MKCVAGDEWCSGNCLWCRGMRRERAQTRFVLIIAAIATIGLAGLVYLARAA